MSILAEYREEDSLHPSSGIKTNTPTTVYLHIGAPKTGTSAIQVALARNRAILAQHNVIYPEAPSDKLALDGHINSGNSDLLHLLLWPNQNNGKAAKRSSKKIENLFEQNRGKLVLFSSEHISKAPVENLRTTP